MFNPQFFAIEEMTSEKKTSTRNQHIPDIPIKSVTYPSCSKKSLHFPFSQAFPSFPDHYETLEILGNSWMLIFFSWCPP